MNAFHRTSIFDEWLTQLKDKTGKALILKRIRSAEAGNLGDCQPVSQGVSEMRVCYGQGIALTSRVQAAWFTCCFAVVTKAVSKAILPKP